MFHKAVSSYASLNHWNTGKNPIVFTISHKYHYNAVHFIKFTTAYSTSHLDLLPFHMITVCQSLTIAVERQIMMSFWNYITICFHFYLSWLQETLRLNLPVIVKSNVSLCAFPWIPHSQCWFLPTIFATRLNVPFQLCCNATACRELSLLTGWHPVTMLLIYLTHASIDCASFRFACIRTTHTYEILLQYKPSLE